MTGKEIIKWIKEEHMEDAEAYVWEGIEYKKVENLWESEKNGGSIIIDTHKAEKVDTKEEEE